jgi:hypothetical protein
MVRFFCDRCAAELEGPDDLVEVVAEGRERPSLAAWSLRSEVCRTCYESLRESMTALFESSEEGKRKPVRRSG